MKNLVILCFIMSLNVSANTVDSVYSQNSKLASELQVEVIEAVLEKFPCIDNYGLSEQVTSVEIDEVDQGIRDEYYTTTFTARYHYDYHPNSAKVIVKSILWDVSNPSIDRTEVTSIEGFLLCE